MKKKMYQWAVIGAGPAGIAAIGKLLDNKISPETILWIDPDFKVGDLGRLWSQVSSNTKVSYFIDFLESVESFEYKQAKRSFTLNHLEPENTCILKEVVEPLQWVTERLMKQVVTSHTKVHSLCLSKQTWSIDSDANTFLAKNVILATGAIPKTLNYPVTNVLPFETAIDKEKLSQAVCVDETIAVFGSSHSAIIIIRHLVELGIKKIYNFYRSPCRYAIDMGTWILFDNTGLKGQTATWARTHIDGTLPENLLRFTVNDHRIARYLPDCDQVIYAVGFEKRDHIVIGDSEENAHNPHVGIIAPGLFGLGIAYPELKADPFGNMESQVGLWKFMVYLNKVMPLWLKYTTEFG